MLSAFSSRREIHVRGRALLRLQHDVSDSAAEKSFRCSVSSTCRVKCTLSYAGW